MHIKKIYFPKNYPKSHNEDYGLIILNENIGKETGFFNLRIFDEEEDGNSILYNCGYPLNRTTNNNTVFYQYEDKGNLIKVEEKKGVIISGIKSSYGQSGA